MVSWGNGHWGSSPWGGGSSPAPAPPEPEGDGHIPFCANVDQFSGAFSVEQASIAIWPVFDLAAAGFASWTWHVLGEAAGISAGKALTIRVYKQVTAGGSFLDPLVGSVVVSANGLFHEQFTSAIPAGSWPYMQSYQSDSLTSVSIYGYLNVVEAYP